MFKKFRRSSKANVQLRVEEATPIATSATQPLQTTFFSLPAELRNEIYEFAAQATTLHLFNPSTQKSKAKPIAPLLLASRQTRIEYLPILLSTATIRATITDLNFKGLQKTLRSLYSTELKALRSNESLTILLCLHKRSNLACANLRRWCTDRATSLDNIAFRYALDASAESKVLKWYGERVGGLHERVEEESIKWEVRRVSEALEWEVLQREFRT